MSRTYAEIRSKALDVLRSSHQQHGEFAGFLDSLENAFAQEHIQYDGAESYHPGRYGTYEVLSVAEKTLFVEVFWDLFREGILTLGINDENPGFPWFHIPDRGRERMATAQ